MLGVLFAEFRLAAMGDAADGDGQVATGIGHHGLRRRHGRHRVPVKLETRRLVRRLAAINRLGGA